MSIVNSLAANDLAASHRKVTILVAEDEILVRTAISEELRDQGYVVIEAATADEALSVLRSLRPVDLVLTDMRMPGALDGSDLVRLIRAEFMGLKVVMISGQSPEATIRSLLDGYLAKPVLPAELASYLATLLPSHESAAQS